MLNYFLILFSLNSRMYTIGCEDANIIYYLKNCKMIMIVLFYFIFYY